MRVVFPKVAVKSTFRWKEGGKSRQVTREFWQTISPFNKNPDGTLKTRDQIMDEITKQRDAWLAEMERTRGGLK